MVLRPEDTQQTLAQMSGTCSSTSPPSLLPAGFCPQLNLMPISNTLQTWWGMKTRSKRQALLELVSLQLILYARDLTLLE